MTLFRTTLLVASLSLSITQLSAEGNHSHDFPKEIMAFHHVMAPLWHMDEGAERTKLSCKATDKMLALTKDIASSKNLADAIINMKKLCDDKNKNIQPYFKKVHDTFHSVSESK